ncbi:TolC family protein [Sunxiuqinia sp. sy24]|uniref:TolC family protein n=1 Tax=Sunxiuqinia sp. sy24 TaxID=3461495 RepID=UPI0040462650
MMKIRNRKLRYSVFMLLLCGVLNLNAQEKAKIFSLDEIWSLTMENNQAIKVSEAGVKVATQQVAVQKLSHLPTINTSLNAFYLGNVTIYDPNFSNRVGVDMPHFGNSFSVQAQQLVFKGNVINESVELTDLQRQLAELKAREAIESMKFLVTGSYLDLFRLYNQQAIYSKNIELAEIRLKNITAMFEQDLVTKDDIIRTRLMVANLYLALEQIDNHIRIVNDQLTTAAGIDGAMKILPDSSILLNKPTVDPLLDYQSQASQNYTGLLTARQNVKIAEKALDITKSDRSPALSLFAGNSLQRPLTNTSPVVDKYSNGWQVGAALSFNISSLYTSKRKVNLRRLQVAQTQEAVVMQEQNTNLAVNSVYSSYQVALSQLKSHEENKKLADENYRMIEKKYENQLALLIDMLDASNSKLAADLQYANAEINILFAYYKLLNATGSL